MRNQYQQMPAQANGDAEAVSASERWAEFVNDYIEARLTAHPAWAVYQGRHEFDGQMPDWSRSGIEAEITRLKQARSASAGVH